MAATFQFYTDPALTIPLATATVRSLADGSSNPVTIVIYYGSTATGRVVRDSTNPGVNQVTVTVNAIVGAVHPVSEIKLASTLGGLDTAVGGDSLALGLSVLSGAVNAKPVYIRIQDSTLTVGTRTDLYLQVNAAEEAV